MTSRPLDLAAHRPRRVVQRLLDRHPGQLRARATAERSARGGQHEPVHGARPLALQQLVQRRVLGVHGDDLRPGRLGELHHELAPDDQRLLVGQREIDALAQRGDGRPQPGRADQRVEHEIGAGLQDQAHKPLGADEDLAAGPRLRGAGAGVGVGQRDAGHAVRAGLVDERLPRALGAEADELEVVGALDDVEGLGADRTGRPEYEQAARHGPLG